MKSSPLLWAAGLAPDFSASGNAKVTGLPPTCEVERKWFLETCVDGPEQAGWTYCYRVANERAPQNSSQQKKMKPAATRGPDYLLSLGPNTYL